jgi:2-methylcitrate dehydratase PrpD
VSADGAPRQQPAGASAPPGGAPRPLEGMLVVTLEQAVAAPFATRQLADLGARVIKIERPGRGDFARHYDGAAGGFTGPADAFGDPHGLMHIYGGIRPPARVDAVLAHATGLPAVHETSVKFHPCCRYMHGVMDLLAAYRSEGGRVEGITRIDCGVLSGGMGLVGEPADRKRAVANMVDAQFSMPFGAALTLSRGSSSLADFQQASSLAAELQPLMDLTWMHTSAELDAAYPSRWGAEVTLSFADGETVDLHTPAFRGSPGWPAGRPEIEAKATMLLGESAAGRLFGAVGALGDGDRFDPACLAAAVRAVSS